MFISDICDFVETDRAAPGGSVSYMWKDNNGGKESVGRGDAKMQSQQAPQIHRNNLQDPGSYERLSVISQEIWQSMELYVDTSAFGGFLSSGVDLGWSRSRWCKMAVESKVATWVIQSSHLGVPSLCGARLGNSKGLRPFRLRLHNYTASTAFSIPVPRFSGGADYCCYSGQTTSITITLKPRP